MTRDAKPADNAQSATELTSRIGKVAARELASHGYASYEQLTAATSRQLLAIHGVGPKAIRILEQELAERGLRFQTDPG